MKSLVLPTLLCLSFFPSISRAQEDPLQNGIQAYRDLEFQQAAQILNSIAFNQSVATGQRTTALSYLGAANVFLGRATTAEIVFRQLLTVDPAYRVDQVVFPPEVTTFFEDVRRGTRVVRALFDQDVDVDVGRDSVVVNLVASTAHSVIAEMHYANADGSETTQPVFAGQVSETARIEWDPAGATRDQLASEFIWLSVASLSPQGAEERRMVLPMEISVTRPDTLGHPVFPAGTILPERGPRRRSPVLLAGLLGGAVIALAPTVASPGAQLSSIRYPIAGGIGLAAIIGLVKPPPGRLIAANVDANRLLSQRRQEWQRELDQALSENERLRSEAHLIARPGTQILSETRSQ